MKVYARVKSIHNNGDFIPYNYNIANACDGFLECGCEVEYYYRVSEIYEKYERGDIVLDGLQQVEWCLSKFEIVTSNIDYPEVMKPYMGRKVWTDTIDHINANPELWGNFVKPVKDKVFTGRVIREPKDLIGCGNYSENYEVLVCEPVDFVYECRGFMLRDQMIDLRPYKGNYRYMKEMDTDLIAQAVQDWSTWKERPISCSLDFGVIRTSNGYKTVFIEENLPYALGCYGLLNINYAKLISAYIADVSEVEDELYFGPIE